MDTPFRVSCPFVRPWGTLESGRRVGSQGERGRRRRTGIWQSAVTNISKGPINSRKALAGTYLLEGLSLKQALIKAGYAESTASTPKQHGLSAEECLREAGKLDPSADPMTLLASARKLLQRKLELADPRRESLSSVARVTDIAEKHYGRGQYHVVVQAARPFAERALELKLCLDELHRRGILKAPDRDQASSPCAPRWWNW